MRTFRLALCFGTAIALVACGATGVDVRPVGAAVTMTPFERAYQDGKLQLNAGRAGMALIAFQKAVALQPTSVAALNGLGAAYDDLHRYDVAQSFYKQALTIEPQNADTLNNLGVSQMMAGERDEAYATLANAASINPKEPVISANLAMVKAPHADQQVASTDAADNTRLHVQRIGERSYELHIPDDGHVPHHVQGVLPVVPKTTTFQISVTPAESIPVAPRDPVVIEQLPKIIRADIDPAVENLFVAFQHQIDHPNGSVQPVEVEKSIDQPAAGSAPARDRNAVPRHVREALARQVCDFLNQNGFSELDNEGGKTTTRCDQLAHSFAERRG